MTVTSSTGYKYQGCYLDGWTRSLPKQLTTANKTVAACLTAAKEAGFNTVGLEYGGECWAGSKLGSGSTLLDYSKCNMACNDASDEVCGGPNVCRFSLDVCKLALTDPRSLQALSLYTLTASRHARRGIDHHSKRGRF